MRPKHRRRPHGCVLERFESRALLSVVAIPTNADAYVRNGAYDGTNYGKSAQLFVQDSTASDGDRETYIRFDYSSVAGTILKAELQLVPTTLGNKVGSTSYRVSLVGDAGDGWVEGNGGKDNKPTGEITWNVRPSTTVASAMVSGTVFALGKAATIDVTSLLKSGGNANKVISLQITSATSGAGNQIAFASRENATATSRPVLVLEIAEANRPPTAVADSATIAAGGAISINVLANDSDPDGDGLSLTGVGSPSHGTTTWNASGLVTYTPTIGFRGIDTFSYTVSDGKAASTGLVTIDVKAAVSSAWPEQVYAPYVDATGWPLFDFVGMSRSVGTRYVTLAFIVADTSNQPSWGGYYTAASGYRSDEIAALRAMGGDVMVSFGGAAGKELAVAIRDVNQLTSAYQSVIDTYQLTHIDFDIEGAWVADRASVDRRSAAISTLQANAARAGKELEVWLTLPVLPSGLTSDGLYVIQSALQHGVALGGVNVMAMDYGDSAAPNPEGRMGQYAIQSAQSTQAQLKLLYSTYSTARTDAQLWSQIGVTPMIGVNDIESEVFRQQDARDLLAFAQSKGVGFLAMWSANRDASGASGVNGSGISQGKYEFATIFKPFTGDPTPAFSISGAEVIEGDTGTSLMRFTVRLSTPLSTAATVNFATVAGTATSGVDYTAKSGTLNFAAGETSKSIDIAIVGDRLVEADETFVVRLSGAAGAAISTADGVGTIRDDDAPPSARIDDPTIVEGNTGTKSLVFTVTLSRAVKAGETVSVDYATASGTATSGSDYTAATGTLSFAAGEIAKTISVTIIGDTLRESDETVLVNLSRPVGLTISDSQGVGTIKDDDTPPEQVKFRVSDRWDNGFIGELTITNTSAKAWSNWSLEFDFPFVITSIWNAGIASRLGAHYVIVPADWTRSIAPGASITIGFEAVGSNPTAPTGVVLAPIS